MDRTITIFKIALSFIFFNFKKIIAKKKKLTNNAAQIHLASCIKLYSCNLCNSLAVLKKHKCNNKIKCLCSHYIKHEQTEQLISYN
ncbi:hypothetical protein HEP_00001700 [Hepatocystis sp. ex Piliocolobus tephrosceles]|nr:hypothetical protein HEP_00001700 [Hepatocystis sp. ex Piliocolobus tephrosceles]